MNRNRAFRKADELFSTCCSDHHPRPIPVQDMTEGCAIFGWNCGICPRDLRQDGIDTSADSTGRPLYPQVSGCEFLAR